MKLISLTELSPTGVSHNPKIYKQALLEYADFPPITQFAQARFPVGEVAPAHSHHDMLEIFFIQAGEAIMQVDEQEHALGMGSCICIEPGERHELRNSSSSTELVVLYFGVQVSAL